MSRRDAETPSEMRRRLTRRLEMKSAELAIIALEEVAADKKAPAPARATAGTTLLRSAGYLERKGVPTDEKPLHEMTFEELEQESLRLKALRDEAANDGLDEDEERGIFG